MGHPPLLRIMRTSRRMRMCASDPDYPLPPNQKKVWWGTRLSGIALLRIMRMLLCKMRTFPSDPDTLSHLTKRRLGGAHGHPPVRLLVWSITGPQFRAARVGQSQVG